MTDPNKTPSPAPSGSDLDEGVVEQFVAHYEFRFAGGGCHTPTDAEREMLVDALHAFRDEQNDYGRAIRAAVQICQQDEWFDRLGSDVEALADAISALADKALSPSSPTPTPADELRQRISDESYSTRRAIRDQAFEETAMQLRHEMELISGTYDDWHPGQAEDMRKRAFDAVQAFDRALKGTPPSPNVQRFSVELASSTYAEPEGGPSVVSCGDAPSPDVLKGLVEALETLIAADVNDFSTTHPDEAKRRARAALLNARLEQGKNSRDRA